MTADAASIRPGDRSGANPPPPQRPMAGVDVGMPPMTARARTRRTIAAVVGLVLVFVGTAWGTDDDFPVGPFRMYSTRGNPDGVVRELRVRIVLLSGAVRDVTNTPGAPRRAELEGRIDDLTHDPNAVHALIPLYTAGLPEPARTLQLVWNVHALRGGRATPSGVVVICQAPVTP